MKRLLALLVLLTLAACARAPAPGDGALPNVAPLAFGTADDDSASALAKHSTGVYVVGTTLGSLHGTNKGSHDAFIRKYRADRSVAWGKQFGTSKFDGATDVAADANNNAYVAGATRGVMAGAVGPGDLYLRKYTSAGLAAWTRQFSFGEFSYLTGVAAYGGNAIYVVGTNGDYPATNDDAFIRRYNASGTVAWTRRFGITKNDVAQDVAVDEAGNVYVAGNAGGVFVRKYSPGGNVLWTRQLSSSSCCQGSVAVSGGNVYLGTGFNRTYSFQIIKFSTGGVRAQGWRFTPPPDSDFFTLYDLSTDSASNLYFAGYSTIVDGGGVQAGGRVQPQQEYVTYHDGIAGKINPTGALVWYVKVASPQRDITYAVVARTTTEAYIAGETQGVLGKANRGSVDAYLRRLNGTDGATVWTDQ